MIEKLRVFIADDERPAREFLKRLLGTIEDAEFVGEAEDGPEAVEMIRELQPDLALLDLQMPEMSGLEVVRSLGKSHVPLTAFVTAFDEFAVQAFELHAVDYLLKPVERSRLAETIARASERLEREDWRAGESARLESVASQYETAVRNEPLEMIPVRKREDILLLPVDEVASIVADGELLHITTGTNQKFTINYRLKDLEQRLDARRFIRLSRGAIVNLRSISRILPLPGGTYLISLENGQEITSSRLQSKLIRARLLKI